MRKSNKKRINILGLILICISILGIGSVKAFPASIGPIYQGAIGKYNGLDQMPFKYGSVSGKKTATFCTQFHNAVPGGTCQIKNNWSDPIKAGVAAIIDKANVSNSSMTAKYYYAELAINRFLYANGIDTGWTYVTYNRSTSTILGSYNSWYQAAETARKNYKAATLSLNASKLNFNKSGSNYVSDWVTVTKSFDDGYTVTTNKGKVEKSGSKVRVVVPYSSVSLGSSVSVKLTVSIKRTVSMAQNYKCGSAQSLTPNVTENKPLSASKSISGTIKKPSYTVTVKKIDSETSKVLAGAQYKLYKNATCTTAAVSNGKTISTTVTTKSNGLAQYTGLEEGTYYFKEIKAPKGYIATPAYPTNNCLKAKLNGTVTFQNKPEYTVKVKKVDTETGAALAGAQYKLYKDSACSQAAVSDGKTISTTVTTGSNGVAQYKGLEKGTYYFKEVKEPAGYIKEPTSPANNCQKATLNGTVTFKNKINKITVKKQDKNTSSVLSGAVFRLYTNASCTTLAKNATTGKTMSQVSSGSNGLAVFKGMATTTAKYYVKETTPPKGYKPLSASENCKAVSINNTTELVFKNNNLESDEMQVQKRDKYTDFGIDGVRIGLFSDSSCSTKIKEATTSNGSVIFKGTYVTGSTANYYVKELATPEGYLPEEGGVKCHKLTLGTSNKDDQSEIIYNRPYGNLKILKRDAETKKPIKGIKFRLLDKDKNPAKNADGQAVADLTTDANGNVEFKKLLYGKYYIEEVTTDKNYKKIADLIEIELTDDIDSLKLAKRGKVSYILGDLNLDGFVNQEDVGVYGSLISDPTLINSLAPEIFIAIDVNDDGNQDNNPAYLNIDRQIVEYYVKYVNDDYIDYAASYSSKKDDVCGALGEENCNIDYIDVVKSKIDNNETLPDENAQATDLNGDGEIDDIDGSILAQWRTIANATNRSEILEKADTFLNNRRNLCAAPGTRGELADCIINEEYLRVALNEVGKSGTLNPDVASASIIINNEKIDMKISKQSISEVEELPGAKIVITDDKGKKFIEFTSGTEPKEFAIPVGTYTLKETVAPKGYEPLETTIKFEVLQDGNIKLLSAESSLYKMVKDIPDDIENEDMEFDIDHLIIKNNPVKEVPKEEIVKVPDTGANISKIAIISGIVLILGGGFVLNKKGYLKKIIKH